MASFPAEPRHPSILKFTIFNLTFSILFPGFSVAAINSNRIKQQSHQPSSPSPARTACCSPRREPWVTRQRKNKSPEGATGKALSPFPPLPPVQYFPPLPITSRFFASQQPTLFQTICLQRRFGSPIIRFRDCGGPQRSVTQVTEGASGNSLRCLFDLQLSI